MMASEDDDAPRNSIKAINFDIMSIEDLQNHIANLTVEIETTKSVIEKKRAAQNTADGFFKK